MCVSRLECFLFSRKGWCSSVGKCEAVDQPRWIMELDSIRRMRNEDGESRRGCCCIPLSVMNEGRCDCEECEAGV